MSVSSKHVAQHVREFDQVVDLDFSDPGSGSSDVRVYAPPSGAWLLVAARYEFILGFAGSSTLDIKDQNGNPAVAQLVINSSSPVGTRGSLTLGTSEAACSIFGNGYHSIQLAYVNTTGRIRLHLYYRQQQPSGVASSARR